ILLCRISVTTTSFEAWSFRFPNTGIYWTEKPAPLSNLAQARHNTRNTAKSEVGTEHDVTEYYLRDYRWRSCGDARRIGTGTRRRRRHRVRERQGLSRRL